MTTERFHIALEARNPAKGHFRAYSIDAGLDLFGHWLVQVTYGRIGSRGRTVLYSAPDQDGACRIVRQCLRKRSTAPRRIGVPYQIQQLMDPQHWISASLS